MISTYVTYLSYAGNLAKSLGRVAIEPQVSNAAQYYKDNIGKVKSVDDFVNNTRLFSYAMKAYGLEDMTYAKAFMRKVLESDVNDSSSFVNKLTDKRFLTFAKAFQFSDDGSVTSQPLVAQDAGDENDTIGLYTQQLANRGAAAADEAGYYQRLIGSVTSVDDLIGNQRLLNFALTAYGLDPSIMSNTTIRAVLTSDLSDPNSYANQMPPAYKALAAAFSFAPDGSVNGSAAQSANLVADTVYRYYDVTGTGSSPDAAAFKTQYYKDNIANVTSVDDLLANNTLLDVALTSVGLDPVLQSKVTLRNVLTSDLSDPDSVANQQTSDAYRQLAAAFNFNPDGSIGDGGAQSSDQTDETLKLYSTAYDDAAVDAQNTATTYYQSKIGSIGSVSDLIQDPQLYDYVLSAYGLDPDEETQSTISKVLTSDPNDPSSFANISHNPAYVALAKAFNFGPDGNAKTATIAQTNNSLLATIKSYDAQADDPDGKLDQTQADNTYYTSTIPTIENVDDFIKDKRLVSYVLDAFGFENDNISDDTLRKILTSDPFDSKSFVNKPGNTQYRALASAFNFDADGNLMAIPPAQAQDRNQIVATSDLYLRQTMEEEAGTQNQGVRLALYFQRNVGNITSPFSILADKALLQVVQTALGLPTSMSLADIDTQAAMITKKLNIADLQDPKKLNKFLAQFAALYDVNNSQSGQTSGALAILRGRQTATNGIINIAPIV
jgi:hypothetical protein